MADRLCGAVADPIVRNAQEQRQLTAIKKCSYRDLSALTGLRFNAMQPMTFALRLGVPGKQEDVRMVNIPSMR